MKKHTKTSIAQWLRDRGVDPFNQVSDEFLIEEAIELNELEVRFVMDGVEHTDHINYVDDEVIEGDVYDLTHVKFEFTLNN
jgi:hypothetical protein